MAANHHAEHVGSLLRPAELLEARAAHTQGRLGLEALREAEDRAALAALELQRDAGIQVFTDGEVRRENWMASVFESVGGLVEVDRSQAFSAHARWERVGGQPPTDETDVDPFVVGERLSPKDPLSGVEAAFMAQHAPGQFKITLASASMGNMFWAPGVSDRVYADPAEMVQDYLRLEIREIEALIDQGVNWIQLDSLMYIQIIDQRLAEGAGADPAATLEQAVDVDNAQIRAARAKNPEMTVGLHICRGNNRSAWVAEGSYDPVAEQLFSTVEADRFLLEFDSARAGGFEPLRFIPPGKTVVLGLVSTKVPQLEAEDELRRRIDEASRYVPLEQLALSPQCGFASTKLGNLLTVDDERRKLELVATTARTVWG